MRDCTVELAKYVECIIKHPRTKTLWCRTILKELDKCMLNNEISATKKFTGEKFIFKDMPAYVN